MGFACLFEHKWDGCKCIKCGATRDEGHDWDHCTCKICGKVRDEDHQYGYKWDGHDHWQECKLCGKTKEKEPHEFAREPDQCDFRCKVCHAKDSKQEHDYVSVEGQCIRVCSRCGEKESAFKAKHHFVPVEGECYTVCSVCGKRGSVTHTWETVKDQCCEQCKVCGEVRPLEHQYAKGKCIHCGRSIEEPVNGSIPPLLWAALEGDVDTVKELIKGGADVNRFGPDETPLIAAARKGYDDDHMEIVKLLLDAGANVNATDCYGSSAVRLAQRKGLTKMVSYLQSRGGRYLGA